jgi:predicted alpha/beta-fold hydrolase
MPLLKSPPFTRPKWLFNGHLETIYPALFRKVDGPVATSERIQTSDGDFLDLDWYKNGSPRLVIISHGLEGNSRRPYILGMAGEFYRNGYDVLAWNYRGCGEELNQKPIFYHSGATYDLDTIVNHAKTAYEEIFLVGFSLGGNLTLKYLGEVQVKRAVAISVPMDLGGSCDQISSGIKLIYSERFLKTLKEKVMKKARLFPGDFDLNRLERVSTLRDFDDVITGPLHGFHDAEEYYQVNSSLQFLDRIAIPTLILNAKNDPFLSDSCFPERLAESLELVSFEFPVYGGHVGFKSASKEKSYYSEARAVEFIGHDA